MLTSRAIETQKHVHHYFAACPKPTEGQRRTHPSKEGITVHSLSALIIEDNEDLADIFAMALQKAGFETQTVGAGDIALAQLSSTTPNIVILDLNLPRVSGMQILRHIRADTRLADTIVIIATAYPTLAESLRDKVDLVLLKPVSFVQLRDLAMRFRPSTAQQEK